jgi:hypothetical protein
VSYTPEHLLLPAKRLIDTIEVVAAAPGAGQLLAPVTSFDFGAGGDGLEQAPVGGAGVFSYEAEIDLFALVTGLTLTLQPNGVATDQSGIGINAGAAVSRFTQSVLNAGSGATAPSTNRIVLKFTARDGQIRGYQCWAGQRANGSAGILPFRYRHSFGTWEASATPLSSLRFLSHIGASIGAGTLASLYELRRRF